jgi:hypothetical protein
MKSKAGLVPAIHAFFLYAAKTWMPGSPSAKTRFALLPGHDGVKNSRHLVGFLPPRSSFNCQPFRTTRQEKTMTDFAETMPVSKPARWLGRVLSGLVIVFLLFDGAIKLVPWPVVTETMNKMGYGSSENLARSLGIITVVCTVLYSVPPTSILGAILLTGYLGGAMASHVRIDSPLFTHTLFGLYLGLMVWGGLWLRDPTLRNLIPFRAETASTIIDALGA